MKIAKGPVVHIGNFIFDNQFPRMYLLSDFS